MNINNNNHKPGCMINTRCLVYHVDGVCPGPYGQCTCSQITEIPKIEVTLGELTWNKSMPTLKQLQEKGEKEFKKKYGAFKICDVISFDD